MRGSKILSMAEGEKLLEACDDAIDAGADQIFAVRIIFILIIQTRRTDAIVLASRATGVESVLAVLVAEAQ